jgi:hypothetical protein
MQSSSATAAESKSVTGKGQQLVRTAAAQLSLDSRKTTFAFWISVLAIAASLFVPKLLPMVDYPQHLAMADIGRRIASATGTEHLHFSVNYFTYNGLFHLLTSKLSSWLPTEIAGKLVVALSFASVATGLVALLGALRQPKDHALLLVPAIFCSPTAWGFINYQLGLGLGLLTLSFIVRSVDSKSPWKMALATATLGLLCGFTHVLATLILCFFGLAVTLEHGFRQALNKTLPRRLLAGVIASIKGLSPLLLACAYCIAVYLKQSKGHEGNYTNPAEGLNFPWQQKLRSFGTNTTGLHSDNVDQVFVYSVLALMLVMLVASLWRRDLEAKRSCLFLPLTLGLGLYIYLPEVLLGTHVIFPRFAQITYIAAILAIPALRSPWKEATSNMAILASLGAALSLGWHMKLFADETDGLSRVIDQVPAGKRVTGVMYEPRTLAFQHAVMVHASGYYTARKAGEHSYNFARYLSLPLTFRAGQPSWPYRGWEWSPHTYNTRCAYARYYPVVLIRAPAKTKTEREVRSLVFGTEEQVPKLVAHDGRYWAFDSTGVEPDDTL